MQRDSVFEFHLWHHHPLSPSCNLSQPASLQLLRMQELITGGWQNKPPLSQHFEMDICPLTVRADNTGEIVHLPSLFRIYKCNVSSLSPWVKRRKEQKHRKYFVNPTIFRCSLPKAMSISRSELLRKKKRGDRKFKFALGKGSWIC